MTVRLLVAAAVIAFLASWAILWMTHPGDSGTPGERSRPSSGVAASSSSPSPAPSEGRLHSITFVADISPDPAAPGSANELAWAGVQRAASAVGAKAHVAAPRNQVELPKLTDDAAKSSDLVVTLGRDSAIATGAAADAHPGTMFIALDQVIAARPNVTNVLFDEVEMGYLAGFVTGSLSPGGRPGFVGGDKALGPSRNYEEGWEQGLRLAGRKGLVEWAGSDDHTELGRSAFSRLNVAGVDSVALADTISGLGALRDACGHHVPVVGIGTDLYLKYEPYRSCVATSVVRRFDVAVAAAIADVADGKPAGRAVVSDVAGGGITVAEFHVTTPAGFDARLAQVVAALRASPPRSSPAP